MKKAKLITSLSSLAAISIVLPIFATSCITNELNADEKSEQSIKCNINIKSNNSLGIITIDGLKLQSYSNKIVMGSTISFTASANEDCVFEKWSDGVTDMSRTVSVYDDLNLIAIFREKSVGPAIKAPPPLKIHTLSVDASDGGVIRVNNLKVETPYTNIYADNEIVEIYANPDNEYIFLGWSDGVLECTRTIKIDKTTALSAFFAKTPARRPFIINLKEQTNNCYYRVNGEIIDGSYTATFPSSIKVEAIPAIGYRFKEWSDHVTANPRIVSQDAELLAIYEQSVKYNLDVEAWTGGAVSLTVGDQEPILVENGNPIHGDIVKGTPITATAKPILGYKFKCWEDNSTTNPRDMIVDSNKTITAIFEDTSGYKEIKIADGEGFSADAKLFTTKCNDVDSSSNFDVDDRTIIWEPSLDGIKYTDPLTGSEYETMSITAHNGKLDIGGMKQDPNTAALNFTTCQEMIERIFEGLEDRPIDPAYDTVENRHARPGFVWADNTGKWKPYVVKEIRAGAFNDDSLWNPIHCSVIIPWTVDYIGEKAFDDASTSTGKKLHVVYTKRSGLDINGISFSEGIKKDNMDWTRDSDWDSKVEITYNTIQQKWELPESCEHGEKEMAALMPIVNETYVKKEAPKYVFELKEAEGKYIVDKRQYSKYRKAFNKDETVEITAVDNDNYKFSQWSDGVTTNPRTITVGKNITLKAIYSKTKCVLTLNKPTNGSIQIDDKASEWTQTYPVNTQLKLTAVPANGYRFIKWSNGEVENPYHITMNKDLELTAIFELAPSSKYRFYIPKVEYGTVKLNGINIDTPYEDYVDPGTKYDLEVFYDEEGGKYKFTNWYMKKGDESLQNITNETKASITVDDNTLIVPGIWLMRIETSHESVYWKTPKVARKIYTVDASNLRPEMKATLQSLQGILAQEEARVFVYTGDKLRDAWFKDMKKTYGFDTEAVANPWDLIEKFKNEFNSEYIYFKTDPDNDDIKKTINTACTLAGIRKNIIIGNDDDVVEARKRGLTMSSDATNFTTAYLFKTYKGELNRSMLINQSPDNMGLRDYAIASKSLCTYVEKENNDLRNDILNWIEPDAPIIGWADDECSFVRDISSRNLEILPADHCSNLSLYSAYNPNKVYYQKSRPKVTANPNKHYVALLMSDGDNVQWMQGDFRTESWYGNKHRGDFPMTWTVSPSTYDLNAQALDYIYGTQTDNDYFITSPSGFAYRNMGSCANNSKFTETSLKYMKDMDQHIVNFLDWNACKYPERFAQFMEDPSVKGGVWSKGQLYMSGGGDVYWINDKPIISMREGLWDRPNNGNDLSIEAVAERINKYPCDIKTINGYTIVMCGCWSENGRMDKIAEFVKLLGDQVELVTVDQLISLVAENFTSHEHVTPNDRNPISKYHWM